MFTLDDLNIVSRASLPIEVFNSLRGQRIKLDQLTYVGVDSNELHCYLRPDNTFLRLPNRIEERVNGVVENA